MQINKNINMRVEFNMLIDMLTRVHKQPWLQKGRMAVTTRWSLFSGKLVLI